MFGMYDIIQRVRQIHLGILIEYTDVAESTMYARADVDWTINKLSYVARQATSPFHDT